MEEVVDVGKTEPQLEHEGAAVLVIALTDLRESEVTLSREIVWKRECVEALRCTIA